MTEPDVAEKKKMPKGGRKGGARFPQINLSKALEYSRKLVAKTHTGPQPATSILPGVFQNAGSVGGVRASALKQYGLLEGDSSAYQASKLAKDIDAAPESERAALLKAAFLFPKVFSEVYQTFHGDSVSRPKIEQRVRGLQVHPDLSADCTQMFVDSAIAAGAGHMDGENLSLSPMTPAPPTNSEDEQYDDEIQPDESEDSPNDVDESRQQQEPGVTVQAEPRSALRPPKTAVAVSIDVDSSSDPDKLEKQLKLLRSYGLV